jgi:hypothetical protein
MLSPQNITSPCSSRSAIVTPWSCTPQGAKMKAEIESLHAETLAFNYMFTCVLRRMAEIDADLAKAIAKGFDDAANSVENLTIRLGKLASPKHTVKAIRIVEEIRTATLGDKNKPRHAV